ncbi:MAG TPA: hypothetical protein PKE29_08115 [Phycisphaerales bacterium]|nr:hypothetical protein [Phycisphaerales bacterium]
MSLRSNLVASSAIAIAALAGTQAQASFTVTFNGVSPSKTLSVSQNSGSSYSNLTSGKFNFTGAANAPTNLQGDFSAFCIQLSQSISSGNSYSDFDTTALASAPVPGTSMGAAKAALVSELWGRNRAGLSTSTQYAAFQLAIWEIVHDSGLSLTGGTFRASSSSTRTQAQTWLNQLDGTGPMASLYALTSPTRQDFVVPMPPIPAPGAAGLGFAALTLAARRRRR